MRQQIGLHALDQTRHVGRRQERAFGDPVCILCSVSGTVCVLRKLQFNRHTAQQTVGDQRHAGTDRQTDVAVDGYIHRERTVLREIIPDGIHLPHLVTANIHRRLLFHAVQVGIDTVVTVGGREDIDSLQVIEPEEQKEQTNGG